MARYGKNGGYGSYRASGCGCSRSYGSPRNFSSAQAHQHVGQSKFGYTKTYTPGTGFRMSKD